MQIEVHYSTYRPFPQIFQDVAYLSQIPLISRDAVIPLSASHECVVPLRTAMLKHAGRFHRQAASGERKMYNGVVIKFKI